MGNRLQTAAEAAELVARLLKGGKSEAEILAEHSDDLIRQALREARAGEKSGIHTVTKGVAETGPVSRPFTLGAEAPRAPTPRATPAATAPTAGAPRHLSRDLPEYEGPQGGLFGRGASTQDTQRAAQAERQAQFQPQQQQQTMQPLPQQQQQARMGGGGDANADDDIVRGYGDQQYSRTTGEPLNDSAKKWVNENPEEYQRAREKMGFERTDGSGPKAGGADEAPKAAPRPEEAPRYTSMGNNPSANAKEQEDRLTEISNRLTSALSDKPTVSLDRTQLDALKDKFFPGQIRTTGQRTQIPVGNGETRDLTSDEIFDRLVHGFGAKDPVTGIKPVIPGRGITDADWDHIVAQNLTKRIDDPVFKALGRANPDPNLADMRLKVGVDADGKPVDEVGDVFELIRSRTQFHTAPDKGISQLTMVVDDATKPEGFRVVGFRDRATLPHNVALPHPENDAALLAQFIKDHPGAREMNNFDMAKWLKDPRNQITPGDFTTKIAVPQKLKNPIEGVTDKLNTVNTPRRWWAIIPDAETVLSKQDLKDLKKLLNDTGRWDPSKARTIDPETGRALGIDKFDAYLRTPNARLTAGDFSALERHQSWRRPINPNIKGFGVTLAKPAAIALGLAIATPPTDAWLNPEQPITGRIGRGMLNAMDIDNIPGLGKVAGDGRTRTLNALVGKMLGSPDETNRILSQYLGVNANGQPVKLNPETGKYEPVTEAVRTFDGKEQKIAQIVPQLDPVEGRLRIATALQGSGVFKNPEVKDAIRLWLTPQISGANESQSADDLVKAARNEYATTRATAMETDSKVLKSMVQKGLGLDISGEISDTDIGRALVSQENSGRLEYYAVLKYYGRQVMGKEGDEAKAVDIAKALSERGSERGVQKQQDLISEQALSMASSNGTSNSQLDLSQAWDKILGSNVSLSNTEQSAFTSAFNKFAGQDEKLSSQEADGLKVALSKAMDPAKVESIMTSLSLAPG